MPFRKYLFAALAITPLVLASVPAEAGAAESGKSSSARETSHMPPVVPGVIVLGAIAAAVVRLNRRGPR